jgi:hypothetical protein
MATLTMNTSSDDMIDPTHTIRKTSWRRRALNAGAGAGDGAAVGAGPAGPAPSDTVTRQVWPAKRGTLPDGGGPAPTIFGNESF